MIRKTSGCIRYIEKKTNSDFFSVDDVVIMKVEFQCPYCNESLNADIDKETKLSCPACRQIFTLPASIINEQIDESLLDPSDPAGYLNNFPTEDDF